MSDKKTNILIGSFSGVLKDFSLKDKKKKKKKKKKRNTSVYLQFFIKSSGNR